MTKFSIKIHDKKEKKKKKNLYALTIPLPVLKILKMFLKNWRNAWQTSCHPLNFQPTAFFTLPVLSVDSCRDFVEITTFISPKMYLFFYTFLSIHNNAQGGREILTVLNSSGIQRRNTTRKDKKIRQIRINRSLNIVPGKGAALLNICIAFF
uniref:Uncharacterized protein n=1 Tax=Glossina austeni TaxID=7395 RepID=A0A1A9VWC3_GLOAU